MLRVVVGLLALLLTGCATAAVPATPATPATPASPARATPTAAGATTPRPTATALAPVAEKDQPLITVEEDVRRVDVLLPSALEDLGEGEQVPLLIMLHGNNESPSRMITQTGADELAEREGAIVVLPPARERRWRAMHDRDQPAADSPDVAYVAGLIEQLGVAYPVDRDRVFVSGFSMGAVLAGRLACERADLVSAVMLDAGTDWGGDCRPEQPVSVLVMHGSADPTFEIEDAEAFADAWRGLNGCAGTDPEGASLECGEGSAVVFIGIPGASHSWFGDPSATESMWEFFEEHQPSR